MRIPIWRPYRHHTRKHRSSHKYQAIAGLFTETIAARASMELASMRDLLGAHADTGAIDTLEDWTRATLRTIGELISQGIISPLEATGQRMGFPLRALAARPRRLGVFPISGNPIHWLHIVAGLATMASLGLDKVVYVVAGKDKRKQHLAPEDFRHRTARDVLSLFSPLLAYSPLALGNGTDGEENLFRIIASHGGGALHAFYIAGSDHYRRFAPSDGSPETIQKIERGIRSRAHGFDQSRHTVTVVFVPRGGPMASLSTFLDVHWVPALPLQTSSSRIRLALAGVAPLSELSHLPITVFLTICANGYYSTASTQDPTFPRDGMPGFLHPFSFWERSEVEYMSVLESGHREGGV